MSIKSRVSNNRLRILQSAVLPLALSATLMSWSAHANATDVWMATATHASLLKTAPTPVSSVNRSIAPATWTVNVRDKPQLASNIQVTPLEASKVLNVAVGLKLRNTDKLDAFLRDLHTPGSASYRKYLTPAEFKAAYGPTDQQAQAVVAHLQKSGFSHITVAPNNLLITANGNALNATAAFNTSIKQFSRDGKQYFGNDSDAQVPQSLGGIVTAVLGLQNISEYRVMSHQVPLVTDGTGVNTTHSPTALPSIYHAGSTPTAYATSVAVIGWNDQAQTQADLTQFTTANLLDPVDFKIVKVPSDGVFPAGDNGEWALDTQTIIGVSGGVKQMLFYTAPTANNALVTAAENQAVVDNIAKVINCSYGLDEGDTLDGTQAQDDAVFAQAVAQGQIFSVSSGDAGVYEWSPGGGNASGFIGPKTDLTHYSVSEPASSPYVVSVGGTQVTTSLTGSTMWVGEPVWNDGGPAAIPAAGFKLWATGGGVSSSEPAPAWQVAVLGSQVVNRMLPDVAFNAHSGIAIVGGVPGSWEGTSLSSPIFVGAFARIETAANNSIGLPTSDMYRDFSKPENAGLLHDVTSGNNGYQGHGYAAAPGWDAATGWGSFDIEKLATFAVANWGDGSAPPAPPAPPQPSVTALQNGPTAIAAGTPGSSSQFTIDVPAGARALNLRTLGGSGDVTLYVKFGEAASATVHDFVSAHAGSNNESITIGTPQAGTYYITVTSPVTFVNVTVGARYVQP
jgi:xanthomonalisin